MTDHRTANNRSLTYPRTDRGQSEDTHATVYHTCAHTVTINDPVVKFMLLGPLLLFFGTFQYSKTEAVAA